MEGDKSLLVGFPDNSLQILGILSFIILFIFGWVSCYVWSNSVEEHSYYFVNLTRDEYVKLDELIESYTKQSYHGVEFFEDNTIHSVVVILDKDEVTKFENDKNGLLLNEIEVINVDEARLYVKESYGEY